MRVLHLVSHTHWDREWYLPFQQFRLKLVQLVDNLLNLLSTDPEFKHFMLDGQTIVLDDYLLMRPERKQELTALIQDGRLLVGPWHILPDEFLVSPEATIRNLLQGDQTARRFGPKMVVGYIPDPFGHIGQLPQILSGFNIHTACVQRGLSDEPCEFWWQSPDGSRLFVAYLRDGYGSGASLPASSPEDFVWEIERLRDSLLPHSAADHILLMFGNDHMQPSPHTSSVIGYANERLQADRLIHSSLPAYLAAVQNQLDTKASPLPVITGELRSPRRHHLLPGVLSTRMWIKQRNHACESLLEKWAEPFSTFAGLLRPPSTSTTGQIPAGKIPAGQIPAGQIPAGRIEEPAPILRQAWRLLMECHPHDSICGCSIDQVHAEMRPRFDQVQQIGEEITRQSLEAIAAMVDTRPVGVSPPEKSPPEKSPPETFSAGKVPAGQAIPILVFNPQDGLRTDAVNLALTIPRGWEILEIVDQAGVSLPYNLGDTFSREVAYLVMDRDTVLSQLTVAQDGKVTGLAVQEVQFQRNLDTLYIHANLSEMGETDRRTLAAAMDYLTETMADPAIEKFVLRAVVRMTGIRFIAHQVPGHGYRVFWLRPAQRDQSHHSGDRPAEQIENEFFLVQVAPEDGTLTLTDKRTGAVYTGLNRFIDGGDCGDEYNYCPPVQDHRVSAGVTSILGERSAAEQFIEVALTLQAPAELGPDRRSRSPEIVPLAILTRASLYPGVPRLDIHTQVDNPARDHRLRVHFPAPVRTAHADYDGHFDVVRRPLGVPDFDARWAEEPRPEQPQRAFVDVTDGHLGLMIANRGLPEVEVLASPDGAAEIALTLLRCVGWLSRGDFSTRRGHAGPALPTPGAQMLGKWSFDYSILPHPGSWQHAFHEAYTFNAPLRAVATDIHAGPLPGNSSFIRSTSPTFTLSAVKTAEDGSGWIVRGVNLSGEKIQVSLIPWRSFERVTRVNLAEEPLEEVTPNQDGSIDFEVSGHGIVTYKFATSAA